MNRLSAIAIGLVLSACVLPACSGDGGSKTPDGKGTPTSTDGTSASTSGKTDKPGDTPSGATTSGTTKPDGKTVTAVTAKVMVPEDFTGEPVKIIFGYGEKQILDESGKLKNVPEQFLPSISGIANPKLVPGQPYELDLSGIEIPAGEHFVLVAVYVKGTAGTIPQKDKDYVAGSLTAVSFTGDKAVMPDMELKKSQGVATP